MLFDLTNNFKYNDCNDYILCGQLGKHNFHLFVDCQFTQDCWRYAGIDLMNTTGDDFALWATSMLSTLELRSKEAFFMILWRQRNNWLWKN